MLDQTHQQALISVPMSPAFSQDVKNQLLYANTCHAITQGIQLLVGRVFLVLINSPCLLTNTDPIESWQAITSAVKYVYAALKKACIPFQLVLNCCCKYDKYVLQSILPVYFPLSAEQKTFENTQLVMPHDNWSLS